MFINTNSVTLCQNSVFAIFGGCQNEVFEKKIAFLFLSFLCWRNRNRKKEKQTKWKRPKNHIKIGFVRWSSKHVKNQKMDF